ncbi:hypothetical protein L208DRAFT_1420325 [Tricholoma matsutake]|nr:hypothetical protein L208DRAFT_1420325 [Tricholoma matsutake 945]
MLYQAFLQEMLLIFSLLALNSANIVASTSFSDPKSDAVNHIKLLIGNGGDTLNGSRGMIPSTAPQFAMTGWVAQMHQNYVSVMPQPAIWMGESGPIVVVPGVSHGEVLKVNTGFRERGMRMKKETEVITPSYYSIMLEDGVDGEVLVEQSATLRVGHLRFTFSLSNPKTDIPYIILESSRPSVLTSTPMNISFPQGTVMIHAHSNTSSHTHIQEICGSNDKWQDSIIMPTSTLPHIKNFRGYYCARFDYNPMYWPIKQPKFPMYGVVQNTTIHPEMLDGSGKLLSGYALFSADTTGQVTVTICIGTSFISVDQATQNINAEIPDHGTSQMQGAHTARPQTLECTAQIMCSAWAEKLGCFALEGTMEVQKDIFWMGITHALQYPSEQHEEGSYYSGYDGKIHKADGRESYTGYSIWGGWLPMWKNIVRTHADSLIAEAVVKGIQGFDWEVSWEAVWKDTTIPPKDDATNVDYEVWAGLSSVYGIENKGWVVDDIHSESASRTLDYMYDNYPAYKLGVALGKPLNITSFLLKCTMCTLFMLFNANTGFMEARNQDGTWAGEDRRWTEGLIEKRGGNASFVNSLDAHFNGGYNDHTNKPSHHIPYLYALAGAAYKTQEHVCEIPQENYNNTPTGLSGNEDCGQMSTWYIFSAMGFYPVNPISGVYIVGSYKQMLRITVKDAPSKPYIKSLMINGRKTNDIANGGEIVFEMSVKVEDWGNGLLANNLGMDEL